MHARELIDAPRPGAPDTDLDLFEMANLPSKDTGLDGIIYISTAQGGHGPRAKWYPGRPGREAPCLSVTIAEPPLITNNGLPARVAATAAPSVVAWVSLNRDRLMKFWNEGESWTRDEVNLFLDDLAKVPP